MRRIFLVPGFFGFSSVGKMQYFQHVRAQLRRAHQLAGQRVSIHEVSTRPTASLDARARRLADTICDAAHPGDEIHIVGHSTGGLDARLLLSTTSATDFGAVFETHRPQIRSVLSITSPHRGAPLADFFSTLQGEHWLRVVSAMTLAVVRLGKWASQPLRPLLDLDLDDPDPGLLDSIWHDVIAEFDDATQDQLQHFFADVWKDRSLIDQLRPSGAAALAVRMTDAPTVRYGSVLAVVPAGGPSESSRREPGLSERVFDFIAARAGGVGPAPRAQLESLMHELSGARAPAAQVAVQGAGRGQNDGFVPLDSQVHGLVVAAVLADHLDVLGFFADPDHGHVDWLRSGANFTRAGFEGLWSAVHAWLG